MSRPATMNHKASRFIADVMGEPSILADQRHRLILGSILALFDAGEPIDVTGVVELLSMHEMLAAAGGREFVLETVLMWG